MLTATPITAQAFAPYGRLLALNDAREANQGTALRSDFAAEPVNQRASARCNLAVFRCAPRVVPMDVKLFERHPRSTQTFIPMLVKRYIVIVAPGGDEGPDVARAEAFVCGPGQAVHYAVGVWHHPMIALDSHAEFVMLAHEDGSALDCEEWPLQTFVRLVVE